MSMSAITDTAAHGTLTYAATEHSIEAHAYFRTREEAEELAAIFPKSAKVRVSTCSTYVTYESNLLGGDPVTIRGAFDHYAPEGAQPGDRFTVYSVGFHANLTSTGVTGAKNEGGLKRWASIKRNAAKHGLAIEYATPYSNSLPREQAEAL